MPGLACLLTAPGAAIRGPPDREAAAQRPGQRPGEKGENGKPDDERDETAPPVSRCLAVLPPITEHPRVHAMSMQEQPLAAVPTRRALSTT